MEAQDAVAVIGSGVAGASYGNAGHMAAELIEPLVATRQANLMHRLGIRAEPVAMDLFAAAAFDRGAQFNKTELTDAPVLPDYLPGIGRVPHTQVFYAIGHPLHTRGSRACHRH
jgi:hypothetical protein